MSGNIPPFSQPRSWTGWLVFGVTVVIVFFLGLLGASIIERRHETRLSMAPRLQPIAPLESDPVAWAINYPRQYDSYKMMRQTDKKTKYGGSAFRDYLEETPAKVILFANSAFGKEYNQARGHVWSRMDLLDTDRITPNSPGTCWACKSADTPRIMAAFGEKYVADPENAGFRELVMAGAGDFYAKNMHDLTSDINHPIACLDCHDPETMRLRISRPALIEAFKGMGRNIDEVTHQEMRSLVCAQCHSEYYFRTGDNYLIFPWSEGLGVEEMEKYFDRIGFTDWTHAISKTPMIKIQHPDYEVYTYGIHAYRNVSCSECHMPYRTEGGIKVTEHHIRSPLLNIENSCSVCHRWGEQEILQRVESIQDSVRQARGRAEQALARAHFNVAACMQAGAVDEELSEVRVLLRAAQLRWDYVAANSGMGFHAPQECMRILTAATDMAQEVRVKAARILARYGYLDSVQYPAFDTKEKATEIVQRFIDGNPPDLLIQGGIIASDAR
ncbi:MAG: ammonia-forming cytochrome c nitrite reductase subunit c552 [Candidatus Loosdrechtia sp.]|uniref:ammonia-forming cytochrome c nitrite reductase subunit c552 n=1 Tax=Candidatus Loosdrechtia sp. TaxID=3101272 RepID=UPI003A6B19D8|nr:MAG: ammonia-forming cytochrome c nitrite reductase subunit c552 [Candidatus Jettenia sp. AMX2]